MSRRLLHHDVRDQAERRPEATAVVMGSEHLTYSELEDQSNRLASMFRGVGCQPGDRVGLLLEKSPMAIVAMLASLKARCAYVPLDVASPAPRVARIVASAAPRVLLVEDVSADLLNAVREHGALSAQTVIGWLGRHAIAKDFPVAFDCSDIASATPARLPDGGEDEMAHILFTSGSTGEPKGVVIRHANVLPFIEWATRYFGIRESDRNSGQPPLHFDLSTFDVYGTFRAGAQLHLVPPSVTLDGAALAHLIRSAELTQWFSVPSVMAFMARFGAIADGDFATLKRVLWCGEVLPTSVLRHWMARVPHATYTNLYGPTEATIASSFHTVEAMPASDDESVPIGRACDGEELRVLDEQRQRVAVGEIGDLYIGGVGLSSGYWRGPKKTAQSFVADPESPGRYIYRTGDLVRVDEDGVFHFLGRSDSQIKSRGYRIELGEIESALYAGGDVAEAAVVAVAMEGFEGQAICCAYAPREGVTPAELRARLAKVLPSYMLPIRWVAMERLPRNVNEKLDRAGLKAMFADQRRSRFFARQHETRATQ